MKREFDGSYPCKNCPRKRNCEDMDCTAWRKWFDQEWQGIRKAADKIRSKRKRYSILNEKHRLYKDGDESSNFKV